MVFLRLWHTISWAQLCSAEVGIQKQALGSNPRSTWSGPVAWGCVVPTPVSHPRRIALRATKTQQTPSSQELPRKWLTVCDFLPLSPQQGPSNPGPETPKCYMSCHFDTPGRQPGARASLSPGACSSPKGVRITAHHRTPPASTPPPFYRWGNGGASPHPKPSKGQAPGGG